MTKKELREDPSSCWNKAADDEPLFILRAQDMIAPTLVRDWANKLTQLMVHVPVPPGGTRKDVSAKTKGAFDTANAMEAWPNRKYPD